VARQLHDGEVAISVTADGVRVFPVNGKFIRVENQPGDG
jgi:hypothetical protein